MVGARYVQSLDRWYAVQRFGTIVSFKADPAVSSPEPFLDLPETVNVGLEGGLIGFNVDPDFAINGYFYVFYTAGGESNGGAWEAASGMGTPQGPRRNVLSRFEILDGDYTKADPRSEVVILEITPTSQSPNQHNAGDIEFGPDGMLYLAVGDAFEGEPQADPSSLLGSILRIDVRSLTETGTYQIPPDNPFADGGEGAPEVWAYGLRNPWRMSIDAESRIWIADVGETLYEEINLGQPSGNYGWPIVEGDDIRDSLACEEIDCGRLISPVAGHAWQGGAAIIGGFVYDGQRLPALRGKYLYSDFTMGSVWAYDPETGSIDEILAFDEARDLIVDLVPGPDGEAFLLRGNGRLRQLDLAP